MKFKRYHYTDVSYVYIGSDDSGNVDNRNVKICDLLFTFKAHDKNSVYKRRRGCFTRHYNSLHSRIRRGQELQSDKPAMVHKPQRIRLPRSMNCLPKPRGYATECK